MGKPLLTDDIIERAKRGEPVTDKKGFGYYEPTQDLSRFEEEIGFDWEEEDYQGYKEGETVRIPVDASIVKSRRIETVKREEFRSKVNRILLVVVLLLVLLIIAVFYL
ncbi:hypothetical protein HO675_07835 [Streptococcus suis]|nr:hypothetical protein [Streptococcus suis]